MRACVVLFQLRCASKNMTLTTMHAVHSDWSENACLPACVRLTVRVLKLAACQTVLMRSRITFHQ